MTVVLPSDLLRDQTSLPIDHVGLALSKLGPMPGRTGQPKDDQRAWQEFVRDRLARARVPKLYPNAFQRWQRRTIAGPDWRLVLRFRAEAPVLCGMGESTPGENGLSLHPCWGTPVLPGSALKGVARSFCARTFASGVPWGAGGLAFQQVFGRSAEEAHGEEEFPNGEGGAVDFLDGLAEPDTAAWTAEVLTPHFADYYQGKEAPTGFQGPNPVYFLGTLGTFRVVLEGPPKLLSSVADILARALETEGIGAKTRTGYGRLKRITNLDREDLRALEQMEAASFPGWPPHRQLAWLGERASVDSLRDRLRSWLLVRDLGSDPVGALRRDEETGRVVASWLRAQGDVDRWKKRAQKGDAGAERLYRTVIGWLGESGLPVVELNTEPRPDPKPAPGPRFGDRVWEGPDPLPANEGKRARALAELGKQLARGGYDAPSVARALAFLSENGARRGTRNEVRRAYGMPEESD